ncbi:MAG: hypothetical protein ACE5IG_03095, partial [Dehalococcoidia bacterium]
VTLLLRLRISWLSAITLLVLFSTQLAFISTFVRFIYAFIYLGLTAGLLVGDRGRALEMVRMARAVAMGALGREAEYEPAEPTGS